jgi:hypothetical protein
MAVQNIALTYPDAQATRIMTALKAAAATEAVPAPTNAQALAWFTGTVKASLRDVVLRYEREAAVAAAAASVVAPDVT